MRGPVACLARGAVALAAMFALVWGSIAAMMLLPSWLWVGILVTASCYALGRLIQLDRRTP